MKQVCNFKAECDLAVHRPNMSIDLERVFEDFNIPIGGSSSSEFPDVPDTDSVGERIRDVFDVIENQNAISEFINIDKQNYSSGASQNTTPITPSTSPDGGAE